jgi:hypothetical protein
MAKSSGVNPGSGGGGLVIAVLLVPIVLINWIFPLIGEILGWALTPIIKGLLHFLIWSGLPDIVIMFLPLLLVYLVIYLFKLEGREQ